MWFRLDLRLSDNQALLQASKDAVMMVYILDPKEKLGTNSKKWLRRRLKQLNLNVYYGNPVEVIQKPHCLRLLLPDTFCHLLRKIDPSLNIKCYGSNLTESVEFYKELLDSLVGKSGEDVLALSTAWDYLNPTTSSEMAIVTVKDKDRIDEILVKSLAGSGRSQAGTDTIMLDGVQLKITGPHLVDSGLGNRITEYVGGSICVEVTKDRFVWWIGSNTFYQLLRGLDPRLTEVRTPTNLNESIELTECILKALVAKNRNDIIALVTAWDQSLIDQEPSQT
jgi:hypothetical protein